MACRQSLFITFRILSMAYNKRLIDEINKYCSPFSILIIGKDGVLKRIVCPFNVVVIHDTSVYKKKQIVAVEAVRLSENLIMLYIIKNIAFPYYYFIIIL